MKKSHFLVICSILLGGSLFLGGCADKTDTSQTMGKEHQKESNKQVNENQQPAASSEKQVNENQQTGASEEVNPEKQTPSTPSEAKTEKPANMISYENKEYGFTFSLPESWNGYRIIMEKWEGLSIANGKSEEVKEKGPKLLIRHPNWTSKIPRQDIPIMIFTNGQWDSLKKEEFHIGAAPIQPSELGHNSKYVFALPARYNFAFPEGYEEVEDIMAKNPLKAIEIK